MTGFVLLFFAWGLTIGAAEESSSTLLSDLRPEVRAKLVELAEPAIGVLAPLEQLQAVFDAAPAYRFQAAALSVYTDPRWFSTLPPQGVGAPVLELRRWPGDTILALYSVTGPAGEGEPPLDAPRLEKVEQVDGSHAAWQGTIETDAGERPVYWLEIVVPEAPNHLAALLLPGDAGMGQGAVEDLTLELKVVLGRVEVDADGWKRVEGLAPEQKILVPQTGGTPGDKSELDEPWQVAQGAAFTLGLPPGFRARRFGGGVPAPLEIPDAVLWFRGRFEDSEKSLVVVGDGNRAAYVARLNELPKPWLAGEQAPLGAPQATSVRAEPYPLAAERCGAKSATAERWKEPGFDGDWLVFRLVFANAGFEIALPVLQGRRSPSLFWIPVTWRSASEAPAPPPVDPAERFGIRFEQLKRSDRSRQPWMEGYLRAPGLSVEIPQGWFPVASLRSRDGYPIRLLSSDGTTRGMVGRLDADEIPVAAELAEGWSPAEHAERHGASAAWKDAHGTRVFVAREGHAYLFEPVETGSKEVREAWRLMLESVQITRSGPRGKKKQN